MPTGECEGREEVKLKCFASDSKGNEVLETQVLSTYMWLHAVVRPL